MRLLGIDTSCDDTSAAVIAEGRKVLSNVVHSQVKLHSPHGGVVPELASREHLKNIVPVTSEALSRVRLRVQDLDGIAVTIGPGLVGSLLVGLYYAKALAYSHNIPLIAVNHLEGHILSIFLEKEIPSFPFVSLTVSGGHTSIYHVRGYGDYSQLGQTLDDAAGEAFDKVAKVLGLGYPGGVRIEKLAREGNLESIAFPRAYLSKGSFDFSFSGLKTAVSLYIKKWRQQSGEDRETTIADIAAAFQEAVVDVLVHKVMAATGSLGLSTVVLAGGVAGNGRLRTRLMEAATLQGVQVFYPGLEYCTDNGAMIALAGYQRLLSGEHADPATDVRSKYPIQDLMPMGVCMRDGKN